MHVTENWERERLTFSSCAFSDANNNNNNKNLCGRDGRTICGPQCVPKSTDALSACRKVAVDEKTLPMATITGRTDRHTDRQSATQYAAPPREEGRIITTNLACVSRSFKDRLQNTSRA